MSWWIRDVFNFFSFFFFFVGGRDKFLFKCSEASVVSNSEVIQRKVIQTMNKTKQNKLEFMKTQQILSRRSEKCLNCKYGYSHLQNMITPIRKAFLLNFCIWKCVQWNQVKGEKMSALSTTNVACKHLAIKRPAICLS